MAPPTIEINLLNQRVADRESRSQQGDFVSERDANNLEEAFVRCD